MTDKKFQTIRGLAAMTFVTALTLAFLVHCSGDKSVQSEGQRLNVHMKLASPDMAHLIVSIRVTVVPENGGDPIVVLLAVIDGEYAGLIVGVPLGTVTVISEALDDSGRVVYRGEETMVVTAGDASEVEVDLEPYGMMIRLTPRSVTNAGGEPFALDVEVFNIPELNHVSFRIYYASDLVRPDSAQPGSSIQDGQTIFFDFQDTLSNEPPYYAFGISHTTSSEPIVDEDGYANLARVYFSSAVPALPAVTTITIDSLALYDIGGIAIDNELTYREGCVVSFTGGTADLVAPGPILDLAVDSVQQSAAFLSWTAPGDDLYFGTADHYDVRVSTAPITLLNWSAAQAVTATPAPVASGGKQTLAIPEIDMTVPRYFVVRAVDEAGNYAALSNQPIGQAVDITAPSAVSDLQITAQTTTSVTLSWTAVGDNGAVGTATTYDVRMSTELLTSSNWASATQFTNEPTPGAAGTSQSMTVAVQHNQPYYFAMRVADEVPNWSTISNNVLSTPPDATAPAAIEDLEVIEAGGTTVTLQWTAPGDDGRTGTAESYDIRYDTDPITEGTFAEATAVTGAPTPQAAGTTETFGIEGLDSETPYYFAIKTADDAANWSSLSNVATATTADITSPGAIDDLAVADYTATTATLSWTAPGDNGDVGTPTAYDLRWSTAVITEANWGSANVVSGMTTPGIAGTSETWTVPLSPSDGTYYFAIKTSDEVENLSELSNVAMLVMEIVIFPDTVLAESIRRIIDKPSGTIVAPELAEVDSVDVDDLGVADLTGLEYCTNLRFAQLSWNMISDISPLSELTSLRHLAMVDIPISSIAAVAGLTDLEYLNVSNDSLVTDWSPILNLTGLDTLHMEDNGLTEISLVASLTQLNYLSAAYNSVTDLSPVSGLSNLEYINVNFNQIEDLSPLQPVRSLDTLLIAHNNVSDLLPLVQNIGLGANDLVDVTGNPLSEAAYGQIATLVSRQVTVYYGEY